MGISFVRTIILYFCVVIALRIMGKRQLGELQPSELVVAIMISDLACVPMQSVSIPLLDGIVPIFSLVLIELIFSISVLKSETLRKLITGRPTQIIRGGKLIPEKMAELRICVDDVIEQLRLAGYPKIDSVDSATIETNGQLSVIPKESERPVSCGDMKINAKQTHAPFVLIADGIIRKKNLDDSGLSEKWIEKCLSAHNITSIKKVLLLTFSDGDVFLQVKE